MRVTDIEFGASPSSDDRVRLQASVTHGGGPPRRETLWFEVPSTLAGDVDVSGTPWLTCLAPLAVETGEPLVVERPADPWLRRNVRELMRVWAGWYDRLEPVPVRAPQGRIPEDRSPEAGRTVSLFSGGADSLFTLMTHGRAGSRGSPRYPPLDEVLFVRGFDVPLSAQSAADRVPETVRAVTDRYGTDIVEVETNLGETRWWQGVDWGYVAHGCAFAAAALVLGRRYGTVLFPAAHAYRHLSPWGSHPLTDSLHSTSRTRVVSDGADATRAEKLARAAESPAALSALRVCWRSRSWENCGRCQKCLRTMAVLDVVGVLEECPTFDEADYDLSTLERLYCGSETVRAHLVDVVRSFARERGREDVVRALDRALRRSRRTRELLRIADWLGERRFFWRLAPLLRRWSERRSSAF